MAEEETTPIAATPEVTEAPQNNEISNTNPTEPVSQKNEEAPISPEQVAKYLGTNTEILEKFTKFTNANGNFEKAFSKLRNDVSTPAPEAPKVEAPAQPTPTEPAQLNNRPAEGYLSPTDIAALQYRNMLASDSKYEKISDYVKSDGWLKEMRAMGMSPVDGQGNLNDRVIRQFLDLKASTVAAQQPSTPVTSTPTVEYVEVGDTITDINKAYAVIQQNMQLSASGKAQHPKTEEAKKFIAEHFAARKNGGRK